MSIFNVANEFKHKIDKSSSLSHQTLIFDNSIVLEVLEFIEQNFQLYVTYTGDLTFRTILTSTLDKPVEFTYTTKLDIARPVQELRLLFKKAIEDFNLLHTKLRDTK